MKKVFDLLVIFALAGFFSGCNKYNDVPDFAQPIVELSVDKTSETVDGVTINIGPDKEYEQDSKVVYKLTVTSPKNLASFSVSSTADAFSQLSKVIQTVPANAINDLGEFTQSLKEVTIYYSFHISPLIPIKTKETLTFTVHDDSNNAGFINQTHVVIKKGSTNGKLLKYINMTYANKQNALGIGTQDNVFWDLEGGIRFDRQINNMRGPFFSLKYAQDLSFGIDAVSMAEDIDLVGYRTRFAGTDPVLNNAKYFLCAPIDTIMLYTAYKDAIPSDVYLNGTSGTLQITFGGLTRIATFRTNVNTTAADFVTAYKADFANIGITLANTSQRIQFKYSRPCTIFFPAELKNLTGDLSGSENANRDWLKINVMKKTVNEMLKKMRSQGKELKTVKFLRLDNLKDPAKVFTAADFYGLTHDNEFDTILRDVWTTGTVRIELINSDNNATFNYDQVIGFVIDGGSGGRGLLHVTPQRVVDISGNIVDPVPAPATGNMTLNGEIKFSEP